MTGYTIWQLKTSGIHKKDNGRMNYKVIRCDALEYPLRLCYPFLIGNGRRRDQ